jgi:CBS domain-containing protein
MGSSGRKEEIIATDQDNAVIYRGERPTEFAEKSCESLETIGIPKCSGNYMACNEMWNQSELAWKDYFQRWFADPIPFHVRYLSVFLDMRPLFGDSSIYDEIVESIGKNVTQDAITNLVSDAVEVEPSLDIFGPMGLRKRLDIKMHGIYPIVNGVRALALYGGLHKLTNTQERVEALCGIGLIDETMRHDLLESYGFLQDLRLRHHAGSVLGGKKIDNIVHSKELSKIDLLILKESLKVVASFRKFLTRKFDLTQPMALREL